MSSTVRSASRLLESFPTALLEVVHAGEERPVTALEFLEVGGPPIVEAGDLLLAVGPYEGTGALLAELDAHPRSAGVVLRRGLAEDAAVLAYCRDAELTLIALAEDAPWSTAYTLLRAAVDASASPGRGGPHDQYADLFELADRVGAILDAPVTVEDAQSRVLAYSSGQTDVDLARTSTIIGRRVPREVREHLRALGVFRHLATSDEPLLVPAGPDLKARWVLAVRAGGEWLGSVWAVVEPPVPAERVAQVRVAADVLALHLLRLRSQTELHQQVRAEQVRALLRAGEGTVPDEVGPPHRAVLLTGPRTGLPAEERLVAWAATLRRRGWRHPLLADLDSAVHLLVAASGEGPGSWPWLAPLVAGEPGRQHGLGAYAGGPVPAADLPRSREQAVELAATVRDRVAAAEDHWAEVLLARAARGARLGARIRTPVGELREHDAAQGTAYVATLAAVLDHWGDPRRAARALGVHPNTVRNRVERLTALSGLDLTDPEQRQAAWLEAGRWRTASAASPRSGAQRTKSSQSSDR
jgi:hypothetical protein